MNTPAWPHENPRRLVFILFFTLLAVPLAAQDDELMELTFPDRGTTVEDLLALAAEVTGAQFTLKTPDLASHPIRHVGRRFVRRTHVMPLVETLLFANGLATNRMGGAGIEVIMVQRFDDPAQFHRHADFIPLARIDDAREMEGRFIRTMVPLRHLPAARAKSLLRQFAPRSQSGVVTEFDGRRGSLLIADFGPSVWAMCRMLGALDVAASLTGRTFGNLRLVNHDAKEVGEALQDLVAGRRSGGARRAPERAAVARDPESSGTWVVHDRRTNSIVVQGTVDEVAGLLGIAAGLDIGAQQPESSLRVHALKHRDAEDVEETLLALLFRRPRTREEGASDPVPPVTPGEREDGRGREDGRNAGARRPTTPTPTPRPNENRNRGVGRAPGGEEDALWDDVRLVADPGSNSLVVSAPKGRHRELGELIAKLDRPRHQVHVEVLMAEVAESDLHRFGVELGASADGSSGLFGITAFGLSTLMSGSSSVSPADFIRLPDLSFEGLSAGVFSHMLGVPLLVRFFEQTTHSNVVSIGSALVDEEEGATISVGQSIPTSENIQSAPTAPGFQNPGGPPVVFQDDIRSTTRFSEYHDAANTFVVTPHVPSPETLRIGLSFTLQAFTAAQVDPFVPPPRSTRTITTQVTVPSGHTVVIGGFDRHEERETIRSIPLLGDIPIVGELFRSRAKEKSKSVMVAFMTARVVTSPEMLEEIRKSVEERTGAAATWMR